MLTDAMGICLKAIENAARNNNGELPTHKEVAQAIRAQGLPWHHQCLQLQRARRPAAFQIHGRTRGIYDPKRWSENEIIQVLEIAPPKP
jgi:hypothetical protein